MDSMEKKYENIQIDFKCLLMDMDKGEMEQYLVDKLNHVCNEIKGIMIEHEMNVVQAEMYKE